MVQCQVVQFTQLEQFITEYSVVIWIYIVTSLIQLKELKGESSCGTKQLNLSGLTRN